MKRKNEFKPSDIKYEPKVQEKKPFYLRSIEKHVLSNRPFEYLIVGLFVVLIFFLAIILGV